MIKRRTIIKETVNPVPPSPDDLTDYTLIGVCRDGSLFFGAATANPHEWAAELRRIVATLMESPTLLRAAAGDAEATASLPEHVEPQH